VNLHSRGIQQLLGKLSSLFLIDAGKRFGPSPPGETMLQNGYSAGYKTPFTVESPFYNMVSPSGGGPKHFPASITNTLESFPNNCCIPRDCRFTSYFIKNM
jgi:hypothetical protein